MKTTVLNLKTTAKSAILCALVSLNSTTATSQSISGANGLVFNNPQLQTASNTDNKKGAIYLFNNVLPNVKATVKIEDLVGGAEVRKIDDNTSNLGYANAFQPELKIPGGLAGESYAVFTFTFYNMATGQLQSIDSLRASAVDIDGNIQLKEFAEIDMAGGVANYMSTTLDISVLQMLLNKFKGSNLLGIERDGIDTSAWGNMFTVRKSNVSTFKVKFGASKLIAGSGNRQFSLYMKGFQYPNQITLPVKLESFVAQLNTAGNKADLKWVTSSEKNVSHFVIEKSTDGKNFEDAGIVFAFGNSSEKITYSYSDNISAGQSMIYYRLRSVDADGKLDYSATRLIRTKQTINTVTILTFPNPVTSELRITIPNSWQGKRVIYEVINNNGVAAMKSVSANAGQTENIDANKLAPGFYIVKVSCGEETATQKIVKQ